MSAERLSSVLLESLEAGVIVEAKRKMASVHVKDATKSLIAAAQGFQRAKKDEREKMGGMDTFRSLMRLSDEVAQLAVKMGVKKGGS